MPDQTHTFKINEVKCSETGENYAPQVYIDEADENAHCSMWFTTRPGISHDEVHSFTCASARGKQQGRPAFVAHRHVRHL
jgi:hypothetical protein